MEQAMWEKIDVQYFSGTSTIMTERLKTPTGWLVRTTVVVKDKTSDSVVAMSSHTEPVADLHHSWHPWPK